MTDASPITAAVLVIGDEILSGRTKDRNTGYIADTLTDIGIDLEEVRIVSDRMEAIVEAVRALSSRYDYVLTTGGIGPTHDDITADAVAAAFGVPLVFDERATAILKAHYDRRGVEMNDARRRMTRIPEGADLIPNPVSAAPGFAIGNVFVMAGVPAIMQAMMDDVVKRLPAARPLLSETIEAGRGEGDVAAALTRVQEQFPAVRMGSYPYHDGTRFTTRLVLRSRDGAMLAAAAEALRAALAGI
ncbi:competence/damage-inducible protein A [Faunimonas sp. B44]|uniref:competence/damage-inducible protein A n=1 Tax=Faunimonas sp. B44 TaxID=3461493 RepID=UPI0040447797